MSWKLVGGVGGLVALAAVLGAQVAVAQAPARTARCIAVNQDAGFIDAKELERFMNGQLGEGKTDFVTVRGITTMVCAW